MRNRQSKLFPAVYSRPETLPLFLIFACWSYQKTDNVWTPILSLALVNLVCSLAAMLLF